MHHLFCILALCFSLPVLAQSNTEVRPSTTNSNNSNYQLNTNSVPVVLDSVRYEVTPAGDQLKQEKVVSGKNNTTAPSKKTEENREMELKEEARPAPVTDTQAPATLRMQEQFQSNQMNASHQYSRRSASPVEQMNMDQSVQYYQKAVPESFETHFYTYLAGHYNVDLYPELRAAAAIDGENTEVKKQEAAYFIIMSETDSAVGKIRELIDSEVISPGQLAYANDLLVSGQENSTIVMHGFDDMLSAYYVQNNSGVRQDVELLSLDFMQSHLYRSHWTNKDMVLPQTEMIDTAYLAELCRLNADRTLQLSLTIPKDYFTGIKSELYPVGLTFQYSETPVDNYTKNNALWMSEMRKELVHHPMNDSGDKWSPNYLLMMITLRKQLIELNELKRAEVLNQAILELGARNNAGTKVKKYTE